jgi:Co/Zn/Cd efflux system component
MSSANISNSLSIADSLHNTLQVSSSKVSTWYTNWIQYRTHPSYIFTLSQI